MNAALSKNAAEFRMYNAAGTLTSSQVQCNVCPIWRGTDRVYHLDGHRPASLGICDKSASPAICDDVVRPALRTVVRPTPPGSAIYRT